MISNNLEKRQMRECAFAYLTKYKPSTGKLNSYLLQKQYAQADIAELISELVERHYLDDYVLACKILLTYRGTKSRGRTALRLILLKRGIEAKCCELALDEFFQERNEADLLADFLASSCRVLLLELAEAEADKLMQRKILHRLTSKCLRRGFSAYDVRQALSKELGDAAYTELHSNTWA